MNAFQTGFVETRVAFDKNNNMENVNSNFFCGAAYFGT